MPSQRVLDTLAVVLLCQALPHAIAHGAVPSNDVYTNMNMSRAHHRHDDCAMARPMVMKDVEDFPDIPSYFLHPEHSGFMFAHIAVMTLAWVVVLPLAVMLSIGRSRAKLPSQIFFLILNAIGVLLSIIYRVQVPDLYPSNAHHRLGWTVTCIAGIWTALSLIHVYTRQRDDVVRPSIQSVSRKVMTDYQRLNNPDGFDEHRWSQDSGDGHGSSTDTLCNHSRVNSWNTESSDVPTKTKHAGIEDDQTYSDDEKQGFLRDTRIDCFMSRNASFLSSRISKAINILQFILERSMIPLAFISLITGIVTYSGISRGGHIFNVLAHLIKGGIFFWYGILTFGRWMGCFGDLGWAWNLNPGAEIVGCGKARMPSAEFIESFVIFFYGASNVFLEHLGAWGKEWSAMDFEHVSITIMFFGGGLLGMLIESGRVRKFLSNGMNSTSDFSQRPSSEWAKPGSYVHPLNPIPSLVILLLGIMMSNHTQHSLVSGQIHRQWGLLFAGFALARSLTYITFWLKPPVSYLPSRPPTELLAAFCLVSGGAIFMASNKDSINALEEYHLDSMFVFTVMMGLTCLIMAWTLFVVAVKGWAVRQQQRRSGAASPPESPA